MNLTTELHSIKKVVESNRINLLLELNDGYSLLIEGSFTLKHGNETILNSIDYALSDFSSGHLKSIRTYLENRIISAAYFSEETGKLSIEMERDVVFESYLGVDDFESWELHKDGHIIYGSECGVIIRY